MANVMKSAPIVANDTTVQWPALQTFDSYNLRLKKRYSRPSDIKIFTILIDNSINHK